jgi:sigma-B regulation protein RsbU (phosphoserine phosphatase)
VPDRRRIELLRQVSLFAGLKPEHLAGLARRMRPQEFGTGQTIFRQGDAGDCLYVVLEGQVRIELLAEDGSSTTLAVREPGQFFGEMALLDDKPRSAAAVALAPVHTLALSREDFHHFLRLSPHAATHILAVLSERLRQSSERLQELAIGRRIQISLLAPPHLRRGSFEILSRSEPATEVGGDFYNLFELEGSGESHPPGRAAAGTRLGLVLGDVAGKGVPAALFMAVTTTLIEAQAQLLASPAATLAAANTLLGPKMRPVGGRQPRFVTAVYGVLDTVTGELRWANAGQTPPIYWPVSGPPRYLRLTGVPLGALPGSTYEEAVLRLATGDRLILFSDGFIDAHGPDGYTDFLQRLEELGKQNGWELISTLFETGKPALSGTDDPMARDDRTLMLITAGETVFQ